MAKQKLEIIISAKDQTKGVLGGLKQGLGGIAKLGAAAAVTGIGAMAAGVAGLTAGMVALTAQAAKVGPIKQSFEAITDGAAAYDMLAKSSDETLKALQKGAKGMISNTKLMKTYNAAAGLVSKKFADELPEAMKYLSKVSGATGKDMDYLLGSLVDGVGRLSPMILDNLLVTMDMEQAYADWAETNGVAVDEMTKSQQQMAAMDQVMQQLAANTADLPDMSDPFARLAATFDNLKDKVAIAIGDTLLPFVEDMSVQIAAFVEGEEFQAWLETTAQWLKDNLIPRIEETAKWIGENLPGRIADLKAAWEDFKPSLKAMITSFNNVKNSVITLFNWIGWAIERYNAWNTMLFTGGMTSKTSQGMPGGYVPKKPPGYNVKGIQNYQHGGSFMVGGPSGIDRTPVSFMATRGERVEITPKGGRAGGATISFTYAPAFSLGNREEMETQIAPLLEGVLRRYGIQ